MKWLLLVLVFQISPEGETTDKQVFQKLFLDEKECMTAGMAVQADLPPTVTSIVTCVSESAFQEKSQEGATLNSDKG